MQPTNQCTIVRNLKSATNLCTHISIALSLISIIIVIQFIIELVSVSNSSNPYAAYNPIGLFFLGLVFFVLDTILSIMLGIYLNTHKTRYRLSINPVLPPATKRATILNILPPVILLTAYIVLFIFGLIATQF